MSAHKIHYIDVGSMPRKEAEQLLEQMKQDMLGKRSTRKSRLSAMIETLAIAASFGGFNIHL